MGVAPLGGRSKIVACTVAVLGLASCTLLTNLDGLAGAANGDAGASDGPGGADGANGADGADGVFTDDRLEGEFGAGTFSGTRWVGDHVELEPGKTSGDFVSRVFDSGASRLPWKTLRWGPGAPYGKPLPDRGAAETGYRASSFDMAKNVLLAHFDDAIVDTSPTANVLTGSSLGGFVPAVFGSGLVRHAAGVRPRDRHERSQRVQLRNGLVLVVALGEVDDALSGQRRLHGDREPGDGAQASPVARLHALGAMPGSGTLGDTFCSTRTAHQRLRGRHR